jgi:TPR repeat protein
MKRRLRSALSAALVLSAGVAVAQPRAPLHDCDRLAARPNQPERVAPGVPFARMDAAAAVRACEAAQRQFRDELRFIYQLARAQQRAGRLNEAADFYLVAAAQGYAPAQANLGLMHRNGEGGLSRDPREALRLFRLAAEQGDPVGQVALGLTFVRGATRNEREAARLFRLAAEQGDAAGQYNLGAMIEAGRGGQPRDRVAAIRLYRLAAAQGNAEALAALARLGAGG